MPLDKYLLHVRPLVQKFEDFLFSAWASVYLQVMVQGKHTLSFIKNSELEYFVHVLGSNTESLVSCTIRICPAMNEGSLPKLLNRPADGTHAGGLETMINEQVLQ